MVLLVLLLDDLGALGLLVVPLDLHHHADMIINGRVHFHLFQLVQNGVQVPLFGLFGSFDEVHQLRVLVLSSDLVVVELVVVHHVVQEVILGVNSVRGDGLHGDQLGGHV